MGAIKENRLYCDERSLDKKGSLKEKRKYKITGSRFRYAASYIFMITTRASEEKNCKAKYFINVDHKEWGKKVKHLIKKYPIFSSPTLIDYTNLDICDIDETNQKVKKGLMKALCKIPADIVNKIREKVDKAPVETLKKENIVYAKFSFGTYKKNEFKKMKKLFGI